ncbi:helix-hairpin-helix domain-containing protein [uncultured Desulfobulbus sp.]|uniref:ComEA family DNA-binding protein n=1 Tax=uncultured Desulfobulbus sp. TaxID=239745 RepID=UPI0029C906EC|nr:helix-hairpin-helix domain-containing protein [uncultured Desulfobulbus sp.]
MKKPETDSEHTLDETTCKDKQTLVLFLLGLFILSLPYLSPERGVAPPVYKIAQQNGSNHWQVVSLTEAMPGKEAAKENIEQVSEQVDGSHVFYEKNNGSNLPAELALFFNRPLPINKSRPGDLEMLPGIGPHLASVIIDALEKKGRFAGPEDLLNIPGIGPKILQRILPLISFKE